MYYKKPTDILGVLNGMKKSSKYTPLTFTALTDDCTLEFQVNSESIIPTLEYSIDGGDWQEWTESVSIPQGSRLQCRGINQDGISPDYDVDDYNYFVGTGKYDVSGNIMTLIDYTNPPTTMVGTFFQLFGREEGDIIDVVNAQKLLLPATTLTSDCYQGMFYGCTGLTSAPELPATVLARNCYQGMFRNCTSLISAPELPATVLADYCYQGMFYGCTSLISAPELPATSLKDWCYRYMFRGCASLTSAPELPAMVLAESCYEEMFRDCTSLTSAPELPATSLVSWCYSNMFHGCASLTSAPELPAPVLDDYCYNNMFKDCTSLVSIEVSFDEWGDNTETWMDNVAASGTFICPAGLEKIYDSSHIPTGWTVVTK